MVSPPDLTELLADALVADSDVSNLVVLTGSARRPDGDAVHFDVLARSANSVLRQVQVLVGDHRNSIVIENVDAAIGEELGPTTKLRLVERDVAPVWDVVEAKIRSDAVYAPSFFILLAIAGLIGAVGILTNSQILIVGAMVVGPEYNHSGRRRHRSVDRVCQLDRGMGLHAAVATERHGSHRDRRTRPATPAVRVASPLTSKAHLKRVMTPSYLVWTLGSCEKHLTDHVFAAT